MLGEEVARGGRRKRRNRVGTECVTGTWAGEKALGLEHRPGSPSLLCPALCPAHLVPGRGLQHLCLCCDQVT